MDDELEVEVSMTSMSLADDEGSSAEEIHLASGQLENLLLQVPSTLKSIFQQLYGLFDETLDKKAFDCFILPSATFECQLESRRDANALRLIADFIEQPERISLLMQGPSGMGKSLLSQYIVYHLNCWGEKNSVNGQPCYQLPLWIYLPALPKDAIAKGNLLEYFFRQQGLRQEAVTAIQSACQEGLLHFTLILDGWDEITGCKESLFLLNGWRDKAWPHIKVIVMSRPEAITALAMQGNYASRFLPSDANAVEHFSEVYLLPFEPEQIEAYIEAYVVNCRNNPEAYAIEDGSFTATHQSTNTVRYWNNPKQYQTHIQDIPGLQALVTTPFLLSITAITLPDIVEQVQAGTFSLTDSAELQTTDTSEQVITRYGLYNAFVKHWFEIQAKRLWNNAPTQKALLHYMIIPESTDIEEAGYQQLMACLYTYSENLARLALNLGEGKLDVVLADEMTLRPELFIVGHNQHCYFKQEETPNEILANIRSGCLLKQQGGSFSFLHKSLIEYFAARGLFLGIGHAIEAYMQGLNLEHVENQLSINERLLMKEPETIKLLADKVKADANFKELLYKVIHYSKLEPFVETAAANAITVLNVAGEIFNEKNFRGIHIQGANLSGALCDGTDFTGANLKNVIFRNAWLANANFSQACLENVDFGEMPVVEDKHPITAVAVSPDGRHVAYGNTNGEVFLLDMATNKLGPLFIKNKSDLSLGFKIIKYVESTVENEKFKTSMGPLCDFNLGNNIVIQGLCFNFAGNYLAVYVEGFFFYTIDINQRKLHKQVRIFENVETFEKNEFFISAPVVQGELLYTGGNDWLFWARSDGGIGPFYHNLDGDFWKTPFPQPSRFTYDLDRDYLLLLTKIKDQSIQYDSKIQDKGGNQEDNAYYNLSVWDLRNGIGETNMISGEVFWPSKPELMAVSSGMQLIALYHQEKIKEQEDKNEKTKYVIYVLNQSLTVINKINLETKIQALSFDASGRFLVGAINTSEYHAVRFWSAEADRTLESLIYQVRWAVELYQEKRYWLKFDRLVAFKYQNKDYLIYVNENRINFWTTDTFSFYKEQAALIRPLELTHLKIISYFFEESILQIEFLDKNYSNQAFRMTVKTINSNERKFQGDFCNSWMYNPDFGDTLALTINHSINLTFVAIGFGKFLPSRELNSYKYFHSKNFLANSLMGFVGMLLDENSKNFFKAMKETTKDTSVRVWDIQNDQQKLLYTLHSSKDAIYLSFSPKNIFLVSCDINNKLKLWDLKNGKRIWELQLKNVEIIGVAVNDLGLITAFAQNACVYFWDSRKSEVTPIAIAKSLWVNILDSKFTEDGYQLRCKVGQRNYAPNIYGSILFDAQAILAPAFKNILAKGLLIFSTKLINGNFVIRLIDTNISLPLQAACTNIQDATGLSHFNQRLLQQRQAKGIPHSISESNSVAQETGSSNQQPIFTSFAFKKATVGCQTTSCIKPRLPLNYNNWTISLLRDEHASNADHTFLFVEGLNSFGRCFFWKFDLSTRYQGQEVESGYAKVIIKSKENVSIDQAGQIIENEMLNPRAQHGRGIHTVVGFCWSIRREQALRVIKQIYHDEMQLIPYHVSGEQSFLSNHRHNCYTWAREKLLTLNNKRIHQALPVTFADHLAVNPETHLTLSPQENVRMKPRACPVQ